MTKRGGFKREVRRKARESGTSYTEALAALAPAGLDARVLNPFTEHEGLPAHLERRYGISIRSMTPIAVHANRVFRVDRVDGPPWIARVFKRERPIERVRGDAEIMRFLQQHDFPAERCAADDPVSTYRGVHVLITQFVEGKPQPWDEFSRDHETRLADLLGELHALPPGTGAVARPGGAYTHDPLREGVPSQDLVAARNLLHAVADKTPAEAQDLRESLLHQLNDADGCDGLPEALTHEDMLGETVLVTPDGRRVAIRWAGAGRGPRLASFAWLLWAFGAHRDADTVRAITSAYQEHVRLEPSEIVRLPKAMRVRPLYYACDYFFRTVANGGIPVPTHWRIPDDDQIDAIAATAMDALTGGTHG